jgi:hypothetical protein
MDTTVVTTGEPETPGNVDFAAGVAAATAIAAAGEAQEAEHKAELAETIAEGAARTADKAAESAAEASVAAAVVATQAADTSARLEALEAAVVALGAHVGLEPDDGQGDAEVDVVIEGDGNDVKIDDSEGDPDAKPPARRERSAFWGSRL